MNIWGNEISDRWRVFWIQVELDSGLQMRTETFACTLAFSGRSVIMVFERVCGRIGLNEG